MRNIERVNDRLFDLMASLTGPEKAYIKKKAKSFRRDDSAHYLKLFDLIEKQSDYNEGKLLSAFSSLDQFNRTKNYLYQFILVSLEDYNRNNNLNFHHRHLIASIEILFNRGLYKQCTQMLQQVLVKQELRLDIILYLETIKWQKKIALAQLNTEVLQVANKIEKELLESLSNLQEMELLYNKTFAIAVLAGDASKQSTKEEINLILANPLLSSPEKCLSVPAISMFYRIRSICLNLIRDQESAYIESIKRIEIIEKVPVYREVYPQDYINALTNAIESGILLHRYNEARNLILKLKNFNVSNWFLECRKSTRALLNEIQISIITLSFSDNNSVANEVDALIAKFKRLIRDDEKIELYFLVAILFVNNGEHKKALYWINEILNLSNTEARDDLQSRARVLNLLIHYSIDNYDLLEYLLRNTINYFNTKKNLTDTDRLILEFVKSELKSPSAENLQHKLEKLKTELIQSSNSPKGFNAFQFLKL